MRIWTRSIILTLSSFLPSVCAARDVQLAPVAPDADGGVAIDGGTLTYLTTAGELVAVENGQTQRIVGPEQLPTGTDIHQFSAAGGGDAAIWTNNGNFVIQGGTLRPLMSDIGIQSTDAIPSADADGVAYTAFSGVALFLDRSGQVTRLADNSTPMPGGNGAIFNRFGPVALRGQQVAFRGVGERFFPGVPPSPSPASTPATATASPESPTRTPPSPVALVTSPNFRGTTSRPTVGPSSSAAPMPSVRQAFTRPRAGR